MKYLLSFGSNLGDRLKNLNAARAELVQVGVFILQESAVYETSPWGFETDNWFYNKALVVDTDVGPLPLMKQLLAVELSLGRTRGDKGKYHSRIVDIDLLLAGNEQVESEMLTVPHPRMHLRKFVLVPSAEIAANWVHPVFGKTVGELLIECPDQEVIRKI